MFGLEEESILVDGTPGDTLIQAINDLIQMKSEVNIMKLHEEMVKFTSYWYRELVEQKSLVYSKFFLHELQGHMFHLVLDYINKLDVYNLQRKILVLKVKDYIYQATTESIRVSNVLTETPVIEEGSTSKISPEASFIEFLLSLPMTDRLNLILSLYSEDKNDFTIAEYKALDNILRIKDSKISTEDNLVVYKTLYILNTLEKEYSLESKVLFMFLGIHNFYHLLAINEIKDLNLALPTQEQFSSVLHKFKDKKDEVISNFKHLISQDSFVGSIEEFILQQYTEKIFSSLDALFVNLETTEVPAEYAVKLDKIIQSLRNSLLSNLK